MYIVRVRIEGYGARADLCKGEFSSIYRAGRSLVKCGKRNGFRASFVVTDAETGKTIVRLYSLMRKNDSRWVAAQSTVGKYHTHIDF